MLLSGGALLFLVRSGDDEHAADLRTLQMSEQNAGRSILILQVVTGVRNFLKGVECGCGLERWGELALTSCCGCRWYTAIVCSTCSALGIVRRSREAFFAADESHEMIDVAVMGLAQFFSLARLILSLQLYRAACSQAQTSSRSATRPSHP